MKKIRKANVITALALTMVMLVAMTGLAAATTSYVVQGNVIDGSTGVGVNGATVKAYDADGTQIGLTATSQASGTFGDGYYEIDFGTSEPPTPLYVHAQKDDKQGEATAEQAGGSIKYDIVLYKANLSIEVPEFATIAIPVGAILGLVLFFNHRKHKKE